MVFGAESSRREGSDSIGPTRIAQALNVAEHPARVSPDDIVDVGIIGVRIVNDGNDRIDTAFEQTMRACMEARQEGTWINEPLVQAYVRLHRMGLSNRTCPSLG